MRETNVYEFPGVGVIKPKNAEFKAEEALPKKGMVGAGVFGFFVTLIVLLNRPLSWFLNGVAGFYFVAWLFQSGEQALFSGLVWGAAFAGGVLVKYLVLSWGVKHLARKS